MHLLSTADLLKKIRRLEISTKNIVNEIFSGEYHSSFKGQGLEFSEVREYQPGDNYRDIDWNVSARLGLPFVKKYRETRELIVVFIVDISASQFSGTSYALKKERIAEIVATLAFSAVANGDRCSLIMYSDTLEKFLPPRKGHNRALEIIREILYHEPHSKQTSLSAACEYAGKILKKRAVIFLLSDFLDSGYEKQMAILAKKHDLIALQVLDDSELELPKAGVLRFVDPETGHSEYINTANAKLRQAYKASIQQEQEKLKTTLKAMGCDYMLFKNSDSFVRVLRQFFVQRSRRRKR
ncbi:MAG: DUF58 domain-containing protein [Candidatus Cloacimonetes bacterium]|nr:DUF58 domain-containing protein [Candidatus Cloacimonadota bacterium]MDD2422719.1 DUF58 domain-containing protein [Candidatus Cloacimonadota bacterium]MDD3563454.1 DUF58 domain-containing protein [Candidatus Cloacimonadota bacterium]MDD4276290.1 DUF58 domain-containing protein [Candidatus Cloacimonadota bacterium]MDY0325514.1 DUF58 domain-containing protein [Candidatus Cloacimonadaceae bacterium]